MPASTGVRQRTVDFVADILRREPGATMTQVRKAGRAAGLNVYPLIMGLARQQIRAAKPPGKAQANGSARVLAPAVVESADQNARAVEEFADALEHEVQNLRASVGTIRRLLGRAG